MSPRDYSKMAYAGAKFRAAASAHLEDEAWKRISQSRPLIRGGSDHDPLREKIVAALSAGVLPADRPSRMGREGAGDRTCACCTVPIKPPQVEYEPQAAPGLYAHVPCFSMWREECGRLEHEGCDERGTAAASA